jgi:predicted permease
MNALDVLNQVLTLFLMMGLGYIGAKFSIINKEVNKGLSMILMKITLPLLILSSFKYEYSKTMMSNIKSLLMFSTLIFTFFFVVSIVLFRKLDLGKKNIIIFITIFSNCGFMGFPILYSIYGHIGVLYTSIFNVVFNLFVWTVGIIIFSGEKEKIDYKNLLLNPCIIAVIIGITNMLFSLKLPYIINEVCTSVGNMTTPISMMIIGFSISQTDIKKIFGDISLYYISIWRLVLIPLITYLILSLFSIDPVVRNVIIICQAMPGAALCVILAENYNNNTEYASQAVFFTTMLSVVTIPAVISML